MKYSILGKVLLSFVLITEFTGLVMAQTVALTGNIVSRSTQRAISNADVSIFESGTDNLLDQCRSGSDGRFSSKNLFAKGQKITVSVTANGFTTVEKEYTINTGKAGKIEMPAAPVSPNRPTGQTGASQTPANLYRIRGTIGSDEPALLKGVNVVFFKEGDDEENLLDSKETNEKGQYESEPRFKKGDRIVVRVKKNGFTEQQETAVFNENKDVVKGFTLKTRTFIAGSVLKSNGQPLDKAQISYQTKDGPWIDIIKTNTKGYFDFDVPAPFKPGETLNIRTEKDKYKPVTIKHTIVLAENQVNFVLKQWLEEYTPINFHILDRKGRKIKGANISHYDDVDSFKTLINNIRDVNPYQLKVKTEPGKDITFTISKKGYADYPQPYTLKKDGKVQDIFIKMEKSKSSCPCWLYAGLGIGAGSLTMYSLSYLSDKKYDDFNNESRQSDRTRSTNQLMAGHITASLSALAFISWRICEKKQKDREEGDVHRRARTSFVPFIKQDLAQTVQIGIAYRF